MAKVSMDGKSSREGHCPNYTVKRDKIIKNH